MSYLTEKFISYCKYFILKLRLIIDILLTFLFFYILSCPFISAFAIKGSVLRWIYVSISCFLSIILYLLYIPTCVTPFCQLYRIVYQTVNILSIYKNLVDLLNESSGDKSLYFKI